MSLAPLSHLNFVNSIFSFFSIRKRSTNSSSEFIFHKHFLFLTEIFLRKTKASGNLGGKDYITFFLRALEKENQNNFVEEKEENNGKILVESQCEC